MLASPGAATDADAEAGARQIARSALCKCSWYGQDPYWGRLASEIGSTGIAFDQEQVSCANGGVTVAAGGITVAHDEDAVRAHMAERHFDITCDLGLGDGRFTVPTNDPTLDQAPLGRCAEHHTRVPFAYDSQEATDDGDRGPRAARGCESRRLRR